MKASSGLRAWILANEPWFGIIANFCVALGVVIAIGTFFFQRVAAEAQRRRDASLQFIAMRSDSVYAEASQTVLSALLLDARLRFVRGADEEAKASDALEIIKEVGIGRLDSLAMFYSSVGWCVTSKTCEREIIDPVFRDEITLFYCSTRDYVLPKIADRFQADERYTKLKAYFEESKASCLPKSTVMLPTDR